MKQINFNCKEKLPYLLALKARDEVQTIRRAWYTKEELKKTKSNEFRIDEYGTKNGDITSHLVIKPPKYKVGEVVEIFWTGSWNELPAGMGVPDDEEEQPISLGKAKITEVFEIEMFRFTDEPETICVTYSGEDRPTMTTKDMNDLARKDGFNSDIEMIRWFEKNYIPKGDTATKKFYVYRGKMV